jgi:hypothetical protein
MSRGASIRHTRVRRPDTEARIVLARGDAEVASWPLVRAARTNLTLVDALARLQLSAQRMGCTVRVQHAWRDLAELLDLAGLASVLEAGGQAEGREQLGVEEVVQPGDPPA